MVPRLTAVFSIMILNWFFIKAIKRFLDCQAIAAHQSAPRHSDPGLCAITVSLTRSAFDWLSFLSSGTQPHLDTDNQIKSACSSSSSFCHMNWIRSHQENQQLDALLIFVPAYFSCEKLMMLSAVQLLVGPRLVSWAQSVMHLLYYAHFWQYRTIWSNQWLPMFAS